MQLSIVHSLKERKKKMPLDSCLEKCRGGRLCSFPHIHASGRQGAASCTSKCILPHHGLVHWAKSKAAVINLGNTHQPPLKNLELGHDPFLKGKQLFLLKWTKLWAFIFPFNDSEGNSKNIFYSKVIQMLESHQESTYRVYICSMTLTTSAVCQNLLHNCTMCTNTSEHWNEDSFSGKHHQLIGFEMFGATKLPTC